MSQLHNPRVRLHRYDNRRRRCQVSRRTRSHTLAHVHFDLKKKSCAMKLFSMAESLVTVDFDRRIRTGVHQDNRTETLASSDSPLNDGRVMCLRVCVCVYANIMPVCTVYACT